MLKKVTVAPEQLELLNLPIRGRGGIQNAIKQVQWGLDGDQLQVDIVTLERLFRYEKNYGPGGFQHRIAGLAEKIIRANGLEEAFGLEPIKKK